MDPEEPRQAGLRRAVSTAYYSLFHLLISEATSNWSRAEQRPALGRIFEHGKMKNASTNTELGDEGDFEGRAPR